MYTSSGSTVAVAWERLHGDVEKAEARAGSNCGFLLEALSVMAHTGISTDRS